MECHPRDVTENGLPNREPWTADGCGPKSDCVEDKGRWPGPHIKPSLPFIPRNLLVSKDCGLLLFLPHSFILDP